MDDQARAGVLPTTMATTALIEIRVTARVAVMVVVVVVVVIPLLVVRDNRDESSAGYARSSLLFVGIRSRKRKKGENRKKGF